MHMTTWMNDHFPTFLVFLIVAIGLVIMAVTQPIAAAPNAAAPVTPEPCVPFAKAGDVLVYRCDDWQMDTTCYSQGLMLFCLQQ